MTEQELKERFAKSLRIKLFNKGWCQKDLANATGISEHTISKYRTATWFPNISNLLKISTALCCSIDELINSNITIDD